ncbi:hypothetical protein PR002_g6917 [Phytophthora rubi]|uniref:Uncharacterized protein n=1 Tax=Phytophthora rubi TaxID=129364 RepID=A0A6A3MZV8_9STRA|nr:hypothetical protein PR002_g6917 [Phytophthora rubi]
MFSAYAGAGFRGFSRQATCARRARVPRRAGSRSATKRGSSFTCNEVWHQSWKYGTAIPAALQDNIRFVNKRRPGAVRETDEE